MKPCRKSARTNLAARRVGPALRRAPDAPALRKSRGDQRRSHGAAGRAAAQTGMGGLGALTAVSYHAPSGVAFRRRRDMLQFYVRTLRLASVDDRRKSSVRTKFPSRSSGTADQEAPGRLFVAPAASAMMMRSALSRSARRMTGKNPLPLAHSHRRGGRRHALRRPSSRQKMRTATFRRAAGGLCRGRGPGGHARLEQGRRFFSDRFLFFLTRLCRAASFTKAARGHSTLFCFLRSSSSIYSIAIRRSASSTHSSMLPFM